MMPNALRAVCLALSMTGAAAAAVGQTAVHPRWVNAQGVNVRSEPSSSAAIVDRLALNTKVGWVDGPAIAGFCELRWERPDGTAMQGHTACRYLSDAPTDLQRLRRTFLPDGSPNPDHDPERLFWLAPSWAGLEAYASHLNVIHLPPLTLETASFLQRNAFVRARNEPLERMKIHLARGIHGPPMPTPVAWEDVQRQARALHTSPQLSEGDHLRWSRLGDILGLEVAFSNQYQDAAVAARLAAGLVRAIELPTSTPSWFRQRDEVASLGDGVSQMSGRFGIVHTYRTHPRKASKEGDWIFDGWWDIGAVTTSLTRPVVRTTLFRDGRLKQVRTHAARTQATWGTSDPPMCSSWVPGFALGDAETRLWASDPQHAALQVHPRDSLVLLHTRRALPRDVAPPAVQTIALDRAATGFVRANQLHFDFDGDGHPDLVAWEGVGRGPGHLDGETKTDDAWYRLFFVNIGGRWVVLGADSFSYGCGC